MSDVMGSQPFEINANKKLLSSADTETVVSTSFGQVPVCQLPAVCGGHVHVLLSSFRWDPPPSPSKPVHSVE